MQLLSKGLKCNLHHKHKKWVETLALEALTARTQLAATEQNYYRHAVAKRLKNINQKSNVINKKNIVEWKIISVIKRKMIANQLTIAKADKGKTITILIQDEYKQK
jgi:hypothetical protein